MLSYRLGCTFSKRITATKNKNSICKDLRPDPDVKREYIIDLKEKYNILLCIDDNPDNCKMYNELGLTALEVKKEKESQQ